jgi:hypothetical protein
VPAFGVNVWGGGHQATGHFMEQLNRVLFAIALMSTLLGSFVLCAKAYDWVRSNGWHIAGAGQPLSQCRRLTETDLGRFELTIQRPAGR